MKASLQKLRIHPREIISQVANGEEITITFRGKSVARIVPIAAKLFRSTKNSGRCGLA